jgi:uncharacterized membrane protein YkgB
MNIADERVAVTGGSSSVGLALAHALLAKGARVVMTGQRRAALAKAVQENRAGPDLGISREPASPAADAIVAGIEANAFEEIRGGAARTQAADDGSDIMGKDFHVSEKGHGAYWPLGILRWVMVLIFVSFGIQKFTPESALGIALYISDSPFVSWLSIFGIRGEAYLLGAIELTTAALLTAGAFVPILSAFGSLMGIGTFAITWSFFFSTPGVVKWSLSTDPITWNLTGEFLYKDVVLLCVCIVLFLTSLPMKVVPLRSN